MSRALSSSMPAFQFTILVDLFDRKHLRDGASMDWPDTVIWHLDLLLQSQDLPVAVPSRWRARAESARGRAVYSRSRAGPRTWSFCTTNGVVRMRSGSGCPGLPDDAQMLPRGRCWWRSYDVNSMLVEALRRHGCCLAVRARWRLLVREGRCAGLLGRRGFLKRAPTQRKGGESPRKGACRFFLGPNVAPSREGAATASRFLGDTHRREPAVAFLFEFVAALQGLPLLKPFWSGAAASNYSSARALRAHNHGTKIG